MREETEDMLELAVRLQNALADPKTRLGLRRTVATFRRLREEAFKGTDFHLTQERIGRIKREAIENLPLLTCQFKQEAEKVGAVVYEAGSSEEARRYILDLVLRHRAKLVVKSKSMTTEEIHLNPYLEKAGLTVVETDLGEWIVQLASERPSHMMVPAIHKPREEIAALFSKVTGELVSPDTSELVKVARRELRQAFIEADIGISGANAAVAETGSVIIVTNEGNARLVGTLPPIHIIVLGYDKIVQTLSDAMAIVEVLTPSVAGQKMASYVSMITGPSRTADIQLDLTLGVHGPKELHIVLVDNGRLRMREDPDFREALYCLKCSACLNVCPVYRQVGGHAYGTVYVGGIGTVLSAFHESQENVTELPLLCTGCYSCREVCPSGIDTPRMITALRNRLVARDIVIPVLKVLRERVNSVHNISGDEPQNRLIWSHNVARAPKKTTDGYQTPYLYFVGCVSSLYPSAYRIPQAFAQIMRSAGVDFAVLGSHERCCGFPLLVGGMWNELRDIATHNVAAIEASGAKTVVFTCPACMHTFQAEYPRIVGDSLDIQFVHAAQLLEDLLSARRLRLERYKRSVTYHDPCHLGRQLGICDAPRNVVRSIPGVSLIEMEETREHGLCCGGGGNLEMVFPQLGIEMSAARLEQARATGAEILVTSCPQCKRMLTPGVKEREHQLRVVDLTELALEAGVQGARSSKCL